MTLANAAREVEQQADSHIPATNPRTQEAVIDQTIGQERTFATLYGFRAARSRESRAADCTGPWPTA
jgi:hypothetical protein